MNIEEKLQEVSGRLEKIEKKLFKGTFLENYENLTAREHAEHHEGDGENHFLGIRNQHSAKQKIESFKNEYDKGAINNLHGHQIKEFELDLDLVNELAKIWNLPPIEDLRN